MVALVTTGAATDHSRPIHVQTSSKPVTARIVAHAQHVVDVYVAPTTTTTTVPPTTTTTAPPPTTTTTVAPPPPARPAATGGPTDEQLRQLRTCESGGNYQANTPPYYGAYQFLTSTWRSMGTGYDRADHAPPPVQDDAARRLIQRSGWGQFPACSRKMGMR